MTERDRLVIPSDVLASFPHDGGHGGKARRLAALMRASTSRMSITTLSPDPARCLHTRIWMKPGPCAAARVTPGDTTDTETHVYQIDNEEIPHVAAATSPLTPNPAIFDGPPSLPTALVHAAQQGRREQAARLAKNFAPQGPSDSAFAAALVTGRWSYTTWLREDAPEDEGPQAPTAVLTTLTTPVASYRIDAPLIAPSTGPHIPVHPAYNTQLWAFITHFFALSPGKD